MRKIATLRLLDEDAKALHLFLRKLDQRTIKYLLGVEHENLARLVYLAKRDVEDAIGIELGE